MERTLLDRLRQFALAGSNHHARRPDVLTAHRLERARIRSEKGIRWGGRSRIAAA
ncbi:hypothetical protein OG765_01230 [Streptomyces sp. NBC_00555]|uniref:hypothetical protein n=1 Tax=Streptomyces sp. NBC_00555 TaxID=2903662 RepID=UPI0022536397|nr:hypothetical protein [Streptomyces sp. NBC_00555]MCX5009617.1 hypothetical protein [Streptomyces sp. NBC_00555]